MFAYSQKWNKKLGLEFNLNHFVHYYDSILTHTTTSLTPKYVIDNFNENLIREKSDGD